MKKPGELCFAEIEFTDENEQLLPTIERKVTVRLEGDSVALQGFGSALCKTDETFVRDFHDSYRGRCLAVFQSLAKKGRTRVVVSAEGVQPVVLNLEVL